jgi:hypothetical protein
LRTLVGALGHAFGLGKERFHCFHFLLEPFFVEFLLMHLGTLNSKIVSVERASLCEVASVLCDDVEG